MAEEPVGGKHWSDLIDLGISRERWDEVQRELAEAIKDQERVRGIIYVCHFDKLLEELLRTAMVGGKVVDELMDDAQPLQPFSVKVRLAYALGLISEDIRKDLYYLNKIRNEFAHKAHVTSFDESPIRELCGNLSTAKNPDGTVMAPQIAYGQAVISIMLYLDYENRRRAKMKGSPQVPPVNWIASKFRGDSKE